MPLETYKGAKVRVHKESGNLYIKRNGKQAMLRRVVYEDNYGPIPEGHVVVVLDRDKSNLAPENLKAVPRREASTAAYKDPSGIFGMGSVPIDCVCAHCGGKFVGNQQSIYCSETCRHHHKYMVEAVCLACGDTYSHYKYRTQVTCSPSCGQVWRVERAASS